MPLVLQQNVILAPYTTLRIGGPARLLAEITSESDLLEALHHARRNNLRTFTLGGGSNLLLSDAGFDGLVLHIAIATPTQRHGDLHTAPAGANWDDFVLDICRQGISGIECLAGIPGTVGGTPVQNVGAYGQEVASTIASVRALNLESLSFEEIPAESCNFAYRHSRFNTSDRDRFILTAVTFRFSSSATPNLTYPDLARHFSNAAASPTPLDVYHAVRQIRRSKGMLLVPGDPDSRSAGSFFKNPIIPASTLHHLAETLNIPSDTIPSFPAGQGSLKLPAAWLLDQAGFHKGFTLGEAGISSRHTLALINRGHASFADIANLRDTIQREVLRRFNIRLEQEPVQLNP